MATIKFEQDIKTVADLRDFLNSLPDPHLMKMPQGDVFQTRILENEAGDRWVHIWVMFRGSVIDLTEELEDCSKPDVSIDDIPSMASPKGIPKL